MRRGERYVLPLGTAGWMPSDSRETSAYALRDEGNMLLLDAGTGIRRLITQPSLTAGILRLDVLLSHFHLDHLIGLSYLQALHGMHISVWGLGQELYGAPTSELLQRVMAPPSLPLDLTSEFTVGELHTGNNSVHSWAVAVRPQYTHTSPSAAFRINDDLVYCTDTQYDEENISFSEGACLLLHEAWSASECVEQGHTSARQAAVIASKAAVESLVLIHLPPDDDPLEILAAARKVFTQTGLAQDLTPIKY